MRDINEIDLRRIDITILLVFLGTMRHRKATAVAKEMGLTQPAVSHALKRLRQIYDDPLFFRRAHGLEPTAFAIALEPQVRDILQTLSGTLQNVGAFDPLSVTADLRIGAFDYELTGLIPDLVSKLRKQAPGINVHAFPFHNQEALDALTQNQIDLAIGYFDLPLINEKAFMAQPLYSDEYVLAARQSHPLFQDALSLQSITAADHLLVSPSGPSRNQVDDALHLMGHKRTIRTVVPSAFAALSILEHSDLVTTLPKRVAQANATRFGISYRALPIDCGTFQLHAVRHTRDAKNPLLSWLLSSTNGILPG